MAEQEFNVNDLIQMEVLRIGLNNNNKIVVKCNYEMFTELEDIEPIHIIRSVLSRISNQLDNQITEIEINNGIIEMEIDDEDDEDDINKLF